MNILNYSLTAIISYLGLFIGFLLAVIAKEFVKGLEIRGSVHNLFDKEYFDPAPVNTVTSDFPKEGISFMAEASYRF